MALSRRSFLKDSILLASATAAFNKLHAGDLAGELLKPAPSKVSPNETIRMAVIGFNGQGSGHIKALTALKEVEMVALCDCDASLAEKGIKLVTETQRRTPVFVQDLRRIMDDPNIDAVSIATPNHWHALASIWAIQAGKDVYVEKPVSHNVSEGRRIVEFARKHGRIVQTGTQSRSNRGMRETIDYVHSGKIGEVKLARGLCYKSRGSIGPKVETTVPKSVDLDLWCGPAPMDLGGRKRFHYDWHWFWNFGNGDLGNQGIHEMDKARWGLQQGLLPRKIMSFGGRLGYVDAGETANTQLCFFDYGAAKLIFEVRGLPTKDMKGASVGNIWYGSEGYVVSSNYDSGIAYSPHGEQLATFRGGNNHFENFIQAVQSRDSRDLNADIEEGHLSSALCHLGNISNQLGQRGTVKQAQELRLDEDCQEAYDRMLEHLAANKIDLDSAQLAIGSELNFDPQQERFIDHEAANQLLTREYRKGFEVPDKV